jgi:hypothetical protein
MWSQRGLRSSAVWLLTWCGGRCIAAGFDNGDVKLFDLRTNTIRWEGNVNNGVPLCPAYLCLPLCLPPRALMPTPIPRRVGWSLTARISR